MTKTAIEVKNLSKTFAPDPLNLKNFFKKPETPKFVLNDISFSVSKGEILGIIGLNGSGKTTLLRTICGIYSPDSGYVRVFGSMSPMLQIGLGFQNELNAEENILMYGMLLGLSKSDIKQKVNDILKFAELESFSNLKLKHFSSGMKLRLAFSTALQTNPDILIVDEALAVGDIRFREKSFNAFLEFKKTGKTILFTTHNMETISKFSDRVLFIDHGKVIMIGNPEDVKQRYREFVHQKNTEH